MIDVILPGTSRSGSIASNPLRARPRQGDASFSPSALRGMLASGRMKGSTLLSRFRRARTVYAFLSHPPRSPCCQ